MSNTWKKLRTYFISAAEQIGIMSEIGLPVIMLPSKDKNIQFHLIIYKKGYYKDSYKFFFSNYLQVRQRFEFAVQQNSAAWLPML